MKKALHVTVCLLVALTARTAAAQGVREWTERGYANVNFGFETGSSDLNESGTFTLYDENGTISVAQAIESGALFDFSVGARVWHNVSAGIAFHTSTNHNDAAVTASVPDPVVFDRPRAVSMTAADLKRNERAVHIQLGYMLPLSDQFSVHLLGGPSFFHLNQEVVEALDVTESGGFRATPAIAERSDSAVGINIGADVAYLFYTQNTVKVGAGMFLRWAGSSANVVVLRGATAEQDSDVGGFQIGFGGRVRF
jgi:outer membrane protein with beta-barrel domain